MHPERAQGDLPFLYPYPSNPQCRFELWKIMLAGFLEALCLWTDSGSIRSSSASQTGRPSLWGSGFLYISGTDVEKIQASQADCGASNVNLPIDLVSSCFPYRTLHHQSPAVLAEGWSTHTSNEPQIPFNVFLVCYHNILSAASPGSNSKKAFHQFFIFSKERSKVLLACINLIKNSSCTTLAASTHRVAWRAKGQDCSHFSFHEATDAKLSRSCWWTCTTIFASFSTYFCGKLQTRCPIIKRLLSGAARTWSA